MMHTDIFLKFFILGALAIKKFSPTKSLVNRMTIFGLLYFIDALFTWMRTERLLYAVIYYGVALAIGWVYFKLIDCFEYTLLRWPIVIAGLC